MKKGRVYPGEGKGTPLQYSCLENPLEGGAWWAAVCGVAKRWTRLSDFTFTFHFHALEKAMATHSSVLAWRIPGTEEPGGLPSMGSHRVGHDWSDLAAAAAECPQAIHEPRKLQGVLQNRRWGNTSLSQKELPFPPQRKNASLVVQMVEHLSAMQETGVWSLG